MARMYGALVDTHRPLVSPETLATGTSVLASGQDAVVGRPMSYGVGFQLQTPLRHLGADPAAFGHDGAGGGLHGAWPTHRVGFSYVLNELRGSDGRDPRPRHVLRALARTLAA